MATLTIRSLPEATKRALKARAARKDRSMEAEVRDILETAPMTDRDFISGWLERAEGLRGHIDIQNRSPARTVNLD